MTLAAIKAMQIPAADDSALFLWAIIPMMPQALDVMSAWGFDYVSQYAWIKPKDGHSRKPTYFAEIIEAQFPGVAKLELFSRSPRPGWTSHGDQLPLP